MGAVSRVKVHYCDVPNLLEEYNDLPVWGTFLDGDNIYQSELENKGFVVFGNEGQGIGQKVSKLVNKRLLIPSWNSGETSESLNVGVATAVVISEFRRSVLKNK